jgi:hypothetical protein
MSRISLPRISALAAGLAVAAACGGGGPSEPPPPEPRPYLVALADTVQTVPYRRLGEGAVLMVRAHAADGSVMNGVPARFTLVSGIGAIVDSDTATRAGGRAGALYRAPNEDGEAVVTADVTGVGSMRFRLSPRRTRLVLSPDALTVSAENRCEPTLTAVFGDDADSFGMTVDFASGDTAVAWTMHYNQSANFRGRRVFVLPGSRAGSTAVVATVEGASDTTQVTVDPACIGLEGRPPRP